MESIIKYIVDTFCVGVFNLNYKSVKKISNIETILDLLQSLLYSKSHTHKELKKILESHGMRM